MLLKSYISIGIIAVSLWSCASNNTYLNKKKSAFTFKVETTPCFGTCPVYSLVIKEDGQADFNGRKFPELGEKHLTLPQVEVDSLKTILIENNFFALEDSYNNENVSDLPSVIFHLSMDNGFEKGVLGRYNTPQDFKDIYAFIERLRKRHFMNE